MRAVKSKAQERREIELQIEQYLQHGGKVEAVGRGISGRDVGAGQLPAISFQEPRETRTPLLDQIKAIEARRAPRVAAKPLKPRQPRRVLITDDFGEPLRWSWRDS